MGGAELTQVSNAHSFSSKDSLHDGSTGATHHISSEEKRCSLLTPLACPIQKRMKTAIVFSDMYSALKIGSEDVTAKASVL